MQSPASTASASSGGLASAIDLADFSLEITGKAVEEVVRCAGLLPPRLPINIAFLGNESDAQRIAAARTIRGQGLQPVSILSGRRLASVAQLDALLAGLARHSESLSIIVVGGDPVSAAGPFEAAVDILDSGILTRHPVSHVGIVGYPQGHHRIADDILWDALRAKAELLDRSGRTFEITTQYCLEPHAVIDWLGRLRAFGIHCPVRIGIPGPATPARHSRFAKQFGVAVPGWLQAQPTDTAYRFDHFLHVLRQELQARECGILRAHLYPFGGIRPSVEWFRSGVGAISAPEGDERVVLPYGRSSD